GVAYYSQSFSGRLTLQELLKHLFANPDLPEAHTWHCSWLYKPWVKDWGFTPPYAFIKSLEEGEYVVDLETQFMKGELLGATYDVTGQENLTIVFQSNNCHPHMANDGFAGTAVMIRLFQWLQNQKKRYSYRLIICPEHLGTVFYLRDLPETERSKLV